VCSEGAATFIGAAECSFSVAVVACAQQQRAERGSTVGTAPFVAAAERGFSLCAVIVVPEQQPAKVARTGRAAALIGATIRLLSSGQIAAAFQQYAERVGRLLATEIVRTSKQRLGGVLITTLEVDLREPKRSLGVPALVGTPERGFGINRISIILERQPQVQRPQ